MSSVRALAGMVFRFILGCLFIFPVFPLLWIAEAVWPIRLGILRYQRIGHLAGNCDIFLRQLQLDGNPGNLHYFLFGFSPANRQLFEMLKRLDFPKVWILESKLMVRVLFAWRSILSRTRFWDPQQVNATEYHVYANTRPLIKFTAEEEQRGQRQLAEMGIGPDDWFICFHARDPAYYRAWRPELEAHWEKTDYRNVDITLYYDAAKRVAEMGGFALRYGAIVSNRLPDLGSERIIDYSSDFRSDFMDIYLAAKCRFFLGSASGPDAVPSMFDARVVSASHFPYNLAHFYRKDMMVPRLLALPGTDEVVPFYEAHEKGYFVGWRAASAFHSTRDMYDLMTPDPADISAACIDMLDQENGIPMSAEADAIREYYTARFLSHSEGWQHGSRLAPSFALKYKHLIVPADWDGTMPQTTEFPQT